MSKDQLAARIRDALERALIASRIRSDLVALMTAAHDRLRASLLAQSFDAADIDAFLAENAAECRAEIEAHIPQAVRALSDWRQAGAARGVT